jgi:IS4 transposase
LLTTLTVGQVNAELLVTMMRKRWEIENAGFRELKQAWHLDHMYHHHPVALDALWLILCVAVNLFLIWYHRQVAWRYRGQLKSVSHFIVLLQGELWATDVTGEAWLAPT